MGCDTVIQIYHTSKSKKIYKNKIKFLAEIMLWYCGVSRDYPSGNPRDYYVITTD